MKKVRDIIQRPSDAVMAMVEGIRKQRKRPDFCLDMDTFGMAIGGICYGCAATCAVQEIYNHDLNIHEIQSRLLKIRAFDADSIDLADFEKAIDSLRQGIYLPLFDYFDVDKHDMLVLSKKPWPFHLPHLGSFVTEESLTVYIRFAEHLKTMDL